MAEGPTQITIRSCNGERRLDNINPGRTTVGQLKEMIQREEGIPVDEQYLVAGGNRHLGTDSSLLEEVVEVDVYTRVRSGQRLTEFIIGKELSRDFRSTLQPTVDCKVLTPLGARLLRGIMSCVLKAHEARLAYGREFSDKHMRVIGVDQERDGSTVLILGSASVCMDGIRPTEPLTTYNQRIDYVNVARIIQTVFQTGIYPLHVKKIHETLVSLSAPTNNVDPSTSTQLMQALVAMVDPLIMATMWWNLGRFQSTFDGRQRRFLDGIVSSGVTPKFFDSTKRQFRPCQDWREDAEGSVHFSHVYNDPETRYDNHRAAGLARFARNWFTHEGEDQSTTATDIPDLDYYFSFYFGEFMAEVLLALYPGIRQLASASVLTKVLVPPSL